MPQLATAAPEIRNLQKATFDSYIKADALMNLCKKAADLLQKQTFDEQARIRLIESKAIFDGKTLTPKYKKPFDTLVEGLKGNNWRGRWGV